LLRHVNVGLSRTHKQFAQAATAAVLQNIHNHERHSSKTGKKQESQADP